MFKYYCTDKNENLIPNFIKEVDGVIINTNVLNYLLLDYNEKLKNDYTECNKEISQSSYGVRMVFP